MPQPFHTTTAIARAQAGVIDTTVVQRCRDIAQALMHGQTVSQDAAELFALCMGPLLDELLAYRQRAAEAMEPHFPAGMPDNVIRLPGCD